MTYEHLVIDVTGPVATVSLNRPEVRNAMDERTLDELADCFKRLGDGKKNPAVAAARVVVLKGEGPDFCAGADVRWMRRAADYPPAKNKKDAMRLVDAIRAVDECPLPVVGRLHGGIYGGGLGLVAACDVAVAADDARMCFSECRLGILPAVVSTFVLPKVGIGNTRRLYLTGEVFSMATAREVGLVHETVPAGELDARVDVFVRNILKNGPEALRRAKEYLRRMDAIGHEARIKLSLDTLVKARSSGEGREGLAAFLEKRPPAWLREEALKP
ncbi:MAG TPA: enoyl-CoA hydratase-related protein [Elusimicrobiota bacterium]|jgi:methylglutaconyl-CoA hydratase|nr:enoyl-CoA hydratase-related protein [Elusimicrobiota bacterium]